MSDTTTRLFVSAVQGDLRRLGPHAAAIVPFVAGAFAGRWIDEGTRVREAVALRTDNGVGPKGYITGTLGAIAIADALAQRSPWSKMLEPAGVWASLAGGARAGAFATSLVSGAFVLLVPAGVVTLCGLSVALGWVRSA